MDQSPQPRLSRFGIWAAFALIALGMIGVAVGYWPGIMIDDAHWQYQQSIDNSYEDWHPPLMAWIWRRMMFILPGPGPMLLLQLALYWLGIGLMVLWAWRRGRPGLAMALALAGWVPAPLALTGTVTKDCLMGGALCVATGLVLCRDLARGAVARWALAVLTFAALLFAAALRLNAIFACLPLALAALPDAVTGKRWRLAIAGAASAVALLAIGPAINAALQAEHTDVSLSLIIFDLGGITENSGQSVFPDLDVENPVAANHRCYDPVGWDSYSTWAKRACAMGFTQVQSAKDGNDLDPVAIWVKAIIAHPIAYARHRLTHFNLSTAFLVPTGPIFTAWSQSVPNPWNFRIGVNPVVRSITAAANGAAHTPIGWPIFWISVALAALVAGWIVHVPRRLLAIAASPFLYGMSYLVVGVAIGMRYYFWTISGAAFAAILVASELFNRRQSPPRPAIVAPALIVAVPTLLAIAARLTG